MYVVLRSTSVGASAIASSGRFAIAPRLGMFPYTTAGFPVTTEWMIVLPYSRLRQVSSGSPLLQSCFIRSKAEPEPRPQRSALSGRSPVEGWLDSSWRPSRFDMLEHW